ncbi:MAG: SIMPL domain-containing protein [Betaproteobacteria bacterium]|nr:SIMPL domain-containing protein [Betaproteobacteria bacterium]
MQVDNDRMTVLLQAEAEKPDAGVASAEVNIKMAKALALAKGVSGVTAKSLNYSTDQVMEKGKLVRWRVTQLLQIETADFAAGANLATRLQDEGLLLSSLTFSVSPEARRKALAQLQHDALVEWQSRARQAAASMGYAGYAPGRLAINAGDSGPRPRRHGHGDDGGGPGGSLRRQQRDGGHRLGRGDAGRRAQAELG